MNVAIIGCGLIGEKRRRALPHSDRVVVAADTDLSRARALADRAGGAAATADWREAVERKDVDAVLVATTNRELASITLGAIEAGHHVLVEKPAARTPEELDDVLEAARRRGVHVQVGFNHRYHPSLQKARQVVDSGALGPLLFVRGRYGHGGRIGYEKEWRSNREIAGGGELLDQGVHLIDLSRWFLGEFASVEGSVHTMFWKMEVEDNGFLHLRTAAGQVAWLHASCTEWKNMFSLEIYGRDGKLQVDGLGGSYGVERLSWYRMLPEMGPPETTIFEYPGADSSWDLEYRAFREAISGDRTAVPGLSDARRALEIVHEIYRKGHR